MIGELKLIAIGEALDSSAEYSWRKLCRQYSERFSTPLHEALALPEEFVLQQMIESNIDAMDEDQLMAYANEALGVDSSEEELIQEQIEMFEKEEEARQVRLAAKKAKGPSYQGKKGKSKPLPEIKKTFEDNGDPNES